MEISVKDIALAVKGRVIGDESLFITAVNSLEMAKKGEISFLIDPQYEKSIKTTKASALLLPKKNEFFDGTQIVVRNPRLAFAKIAGLFVPSIKPHPGVSDHAYVSEDCSIGKDVSIHPYVYVGGETEIGDHAIIYPGAYIGDHVVIGSGSIIHPNVSILHHCLVGNDVIIHAGTVIGADGFGYVRDGSISVKIPQMGIVQIDDHVEIGANNCIDRATLGKTWIKRGVKTDNLIQIAHNVIVGEDTIIVSHSAIGGSTKIGREVVIGGYVAINDHITIGDRAMIASKSGVVKSVKEGEVVSGIPSISHRNWLRSSSLFAKLPHLMERLRDLEKKVHRIEHRNKGEQFKK